MATRKTAKAPRKTVAKPPRRTAKKASAKTATKAAPTRKSLQTAASAAKQARKATAKPAAASGPANIRVRMYRVGFGDFFLLTVPGRNGPAHILIDCGVHAANIGSIDDCVKDMMKETGNHLALVILTHYHADHMSGFASNYDDFAEFDVGAVWITNRLDPSNPIPPGSWRN
jgi:beta-lactamase superfamily II metal-dependent hydrolase